MSDLRGARGGRAAGTIAVVCLLAGASLAQEEAAPVDAVAETAAVSDFETDRTTFERTLTVRKGGNDDGAAMQKQIDEISDETQEIQSQVRTATKQLEAIRTYSSRMRELIASQEEELASVREQVDQIEEVGRSVTPLMLRMIDAIEAFVALDVPFLEEERAERVLGLRKMMARADVTNAEKYRGIMEAYQIENEYGRTIEAYRARVDTGEREIMADLLRFGRIALVYQSLDGTESGVWNQRTRSWDTLDPSYNPAIRQGLRIARKKAPPDLIDLPLPAPSEPVGSS